MELYNPLIKVTRTLLEKSTPKTWEPGSRDGWKDIGSNELVFQKDAAFELGAQGKGSANYVLYTTKPELVGKDQTLLYGPDLKDIKGDCDFARIVLLRVGMIEGDDEVLYRTLKDIEFAKYHVYPEGYMVRMSPDNYREQVRVSKSAIKKGINFRDLGANYIREYKKNPNVLNAEVIFITGHDFDFAKMREVAQKANEVTGGLTHILDGIPTDCSACSLRDICDEVDSMQARDFGKSSGNDKH